MGKKPGSRRTGRFQEDEVYWSIRLEKNKKKNMAGFFSRIFKGFDGR